MPLSLSKKNMIVLITGATGLVGSRLSDLCREQGMTVHYLTTSKKNIVNQPDYKGFFWDPVAGILDEKSLEGVAVIVHLAGASIAQRWTEANKKIILDSRVLSARIIREALSRKREQGANTVTHIVSASAIGAYPSSLTKYYDETYPKYAEGFLGEVVKAWETEVALFQQLDIATAMVRTGIVLDDQKGALPKMVQPIKMYAGAALGSGEQWQSWIHVDDMARLYLHIMTEKLTGIYNGVAPNPVTNKKLTETIAKTLEKPLILPKVPSFALKLLLGDMAAIVLESQKVCADKIRNSGFVFEHVSIEEAIPAVLDA